MAKKKIINYPINSIRKHKQINNNNKNPNKKIAIKSLSA